MIEVWFWQLIISPHMISLANELGLLGFKVNYVVETEMTNDRKKLGWETNCYPNVSIIKVDSSDFAALEVKIRKDSLHIVQGLRNNSYIEYVMKYFLINSLNFWVMLETIDSSGIQGFLRRLVYKRALSKYNYSINGFLTIGHTTSQWFESIGVPKGNIYPFAYFLEPSVISANSDNSNDKFIFIFVGNLIERKRPKLIFDALSKLILSGSDNFELWVVGGGVLEQQIKKINSELEVPVKWIGYQSIKDVRGYISNADCLLLPSVHDGWGAVASEAIIEGTPVICSNNCGVAGVVEQSGFGSVFETNDVFSFHDLVEKHYMLGKQTNEYRNKLKNWGECLTAPKGAQYLKDILLEDKLDREILPLWDGTSE